MIFKETVVNNNRKVIVCRQQNYSMNGLSKTQWGEVDWAENSTLFLPFEVKAKATDVEFSKRRRNNLEMKSTTQWLYMTFIPLMMLFPSLAVAHDGHHGDGNEQHHDHGDAKSAHKEKGHASGASCSGPSCGHHHSDSETLMKIASEWQNAFKGGDILPESSKDKTLLEQLGEAMIFKMQQESIGHHHHHHHHDHAEAVKRFTRKWLKEKLIRLRNAAVHVFSDLWEGVPEYGVVFAVITFAAEAVDHMVMDEFIPVIGMIPMCVLIAEFARRISSFVTEGSALLMKHTRITKPLPLRELRDWSRSRKIQRKRAKAFDLAFKAENGRRIGTEVKKPGLWVKYKKKKTLYTEMQKDMPSDLEWLLEATPLWHEVARQWTGKNLAGKEDLKGKAKTNSLSEAIGKHLEVLEGKEKEGTLTAYEIGEVARFSKSLFSGMVHAFYEEGKFNRRRMFGLRWDVGVLGRRIRKFETQLIRELTDEKNRASNKKEIVAASRAVILNSQESLLQFAEHLKAGRVDDAKSVLLKHRERIKSFGKLSKRIKNSKEHYKTATHVR